MNNEARRVLEGEARIEKEAHIRKVQQWEETCKAREDAHRMSCISQQSNMALFPQSLQAQQVRGHHQAESMDYALQRLRNQIDALVANNAQNNQNAGNMEPVALNQTHNNLNEEQELLRELFQESGLIHGDQQNHHHQAPAQTPAVTQHAPLYRQTESVAQHPWAYATPSVMKQHAPKPVSHPHMLDAIAPEEMDLLFSDF